jgi:hypothetical protein
MEDEVAATGLYCSVLEKAESSSEWNPKAQNLQSAVIDDHY